MMRKLMRIAPLGFLILPVALTFAAAVPRALAPASGGLWEVSRRADGHEPSQLCIATPEALAQYEHRQGRCTRVVISDRGSEAVIHYTCADGGFGQSQVTLLTPRSLKVDTQGISGGYPFHYQLYAR